MDMDVWIICIMICYAFRIWCSCINVIGYQYGSATMVSWLEYINIPIGFVYQTVIFADFPNKYEVIGGILVTIACLLAPLEQLYRYYIEQKIMFEKINDMNEAKVIQVITWSYWRSKMNKENDIMHGIIWLWLENACTYNFILIIISWLKGAMVVRKQTQRFACKYMRLVWLEPQ